MASQLLDGRAFSEILGVRVDAVHRVDVDAIELRGADRTALVVARHMRAYAGCRGDFERFAEAVRKAWDDAGYEQRYLTRPTPRLGMGTRGYRPRCRHA